MHPIERLRYVARSSGADQVALVSETAGSLAAFRDDPAGRVMACRRMLARHPTSGPLWWMSSRVCTAPDPLREARGTAVEELERDRTARELSLAVPDDATVCVLGWPELVADALPARGDLDVLVVDVANEGSGLVRRLRRSDVDAADVPLSGLGRRRRGRRPGAAGGGLRRARGVRGRGRLPRRRRGGRLLPGRLWEVIDARLDERDEPWELDDEVVPLDLVSSSAAQGVGGGPRPRPSTALAARAPSPPSCSRKASSSERRGR